MKVIRQQGNLSKTRRTVYGWVGDGVVYLSPFSKLMDDRPFNMYLDKEEAINDAASRNLTVEWEE